MILQKYSFLFFQLVKRDFSKKYKRTVLGMVWSVLSPLFTLLIMRVVFTRFFGQSMPFYTTYLFAGNLVFSYFSESTTQGMQALMGNASIISKVNVPKYLFLFSKNIQTFINFIITLIVFFVFCALDGITFTWKFIFLIYPILCLVVFNIGVGLILSAMYVFFRDMQYLWSVITQLLMYLSAVFYNVSAFPPNVQQLFLFNPVYVYIKYFRCIVIDGSIPSPQYHTLCLFYALTACFIGGIIYKKCNTRFLYYM